MIAKEIKYKVKFLIFNKKRWFLITELKIKVKILIKLTESEICESQGKVVLKKQETKRKKKLFKKLNSFVWFLLYYFVHIIANNK